MFILHPYKRISPIQEAQMTTVLDENVHNLAVNGTFDDCQVSPPHPRNDHRLTSVDTYFRISSKPSSQTKHSTRNTTSAQ